MIPAEFSKKADDVQLMAISAYLEHTCGIPEKRIKKDWFVLINPTTGKIFGLTEAVLPKMVKPNTVIHNPDIMILDEKYKLLCIIELDGYSHRVGDGVERTAKRNRHYARTGMPFVVIDIAEFADARKNWFEFIDESLSDLGILDKFHSI